MSCPSDETLAAHVAGHPTLGRSDELRSHIDGCAHCRDVIVALVRHPDRDRAPRLRLATGTQPPRAVADYPELPFVDPDHYAAEDVIAQGGMGRIRAARDRRLGRRVAIKELLVDSEGLRERFEREARITARLQHPAIVNVIEAGRWPNGEPFFAMKLVAGRSLDRVIAERTGLAERLALLPNVIAAADALAFAHSQRVIHRDLKPQNILVGDYGETVVIDWGLAKALDEHEPASAGEQRAASDATADGTVMGTPCYMPPEQARSPHVDARADVYALGAILYEVLAGERPHAGLATPDVLADLAQGKTLALDRLPAGMPQDLVAIVAKATAADPDDRYATAAELATDLKKFQTGKLVDAYRYTTWQLVRRWIGRHRAEVGVAAVLLVALAVTAIVSVNKIVAERDVARTQRAAAEKLVGFVVYELRDRLEPVGRLDLMTGVGKSVRDYYTALPSNAAEAVERRARMYYLLGDIEGREGRSQEAKQLVADGIALGEKLRAQDRERGQRIVGIGLLQTCTLVAGVESAAAARSSCQRAVEQLESISRGDTYDDARALPMANLQLARLADNEHKDEALALFEKSRTQLEALAPRFSAEARLQLDLAELYDRLGFAYLSRGKPDVAHDLFTRGVALARKLRDGDAKNTRYARLLARSVGDLAATQWAKHAADESLASVKEAVALAGPLVERDPDDLELQELAAASYVRLAQIETGRGNTAAGIAAQEAARPLLERLVKAEPKAAKWKSALAFAMTTNGHTLVHAQRVDEGRAEYIAADKLWRELVVAAPSDGRQREMLVLNTIRLASLDRDGAPAITRARLDDAIEVASALASENAKQARGRELLADAYEMRADVEVTLHARDAARADYEAGAATFDALAKDNPVSAAHYSKRADALRKRLASVR